MSEAQMQEFLLQEDQDEEQPNENLMEVNQRRRTQAQNTNKGNTSAILEDNICTSLSEVTIYKKGVKQLDPSLNTQIENFISNIRRKESSSSDEFLDTSDKAVKSNTCIDFIVGPEPAFGPDNSHVQPCKLTSEEEANRIIKETEQHKAVTHSVPGKSGKLVDDQLSVMPKISVSAMDQNYQMVDSHVDESTRKKIIAFEYVDFSKLINKMKPTKEDDSGQRLEIVNHNGMSYPTPRQ